MKQKKEAKVIRMDDYCQSKGYLHASTMTPDVYMIQIHLQNMVNTYGEDIVTHVIQNLGLDREKIKKAV